MSTEAFLIVAHHVLQVFKLPCRNNPYWHYDLGEENLVRTLLCLCLLLGLVTAVTAAVQWDPAPDQYKVSPTGTVDISDGGASLPDLFLLSKDTYENFSFEFDITAGTPGGAQVRSLLVWAVDPADHANRKAFFLPAESFQRGQKHHVRLLVMTERALLYIDENKVSDRPVIYGQPPAAGKVGLLHYYNFDFHIENLKLTTLDTQTLPVPTGLAASLSKTGVGRLTWQAPAGYDGLLTYRLYRSVAKVPTIEPLNLIAETMNTEYLDRNLRSDVRYVYTVVAAVNNKISSAQAKPVALRTGKLPLPLPITDVSAVRRLDGKVRLRWQLSPESRAAGITIYRGQSPALAQSDRAEAVAPRLPLATTEYLATATPAEYYAIGIISPDGQTLSRTICQVTGSAPEVTPGAGVPDKHPYLLYGREQLERTRGLLQGDEGRQLLDKRRHEADVLITKPAAVPTDVTDEMSALSSKLQQVALTYQLTGDERYARWVRDAVMGYAALYAKLPARSGRVRISKTMSGLYEAVWYVPLVIAYDLVYESPSFSAEDHQTVARDLLRPAADLFWVKNYDDPLDNRPGDLHYKCYNFEAWFISAVGLTGLLLKDADMVEHAIDGPYGLKHLLAHDIQDDGVFWERSFGYHGFVMSALFPFLEAGTHCNLDLYTLAVPDDYNTDREKLLNYCVGDGDNGPKSMRLMFDGPFYATFPDLSWPVVADSGRGPLAPSTYYRAGWEHYGDPRYAWLLGDKAATPIPQVKGDMDASAAIRLAYDDQNLYLAAQIKDNVVRNSYSKPDEVWQGDLLWVGLKWNDSKGGPYDLIYGLSPGDFGQVPPVAALFNRFGLAEGTVSAGKYAVVKTADGYNIEFVIPISEIAPREGEHGQPFVPAEGRKLTADFVLYDCDLPKGTTIKEKMVTWSCVTDRYDSTQGGEVVLSATQPAVSRAINAPRATGLAMDGTLTGWDKLPAKAALIDEKSTVMTDASTADGSNLDDYLYLKPSPGSGAFSLQGSKFANNGVLEQGCSLFPSTGFALLRDRLNADGLPPMEATCVNLEFGPYGGGHNHPDKLSLVVFGNGRQVIPDFGSCGYDSPEKGQWTAHTISHNTVTVDGKSQYPTGEMDNTWPADSFDKRAIAKLGFFHGDPVLKAAQANCDTVYDGVKLTRTVAIVANTLFDFYQINSKDTHIYDYALHVDLPLQEASVALTALPDPLGKKCGYQHIHSPQASTPASTALTSLWGKDDEQLRITCAPGEPTQLITGESITTSLDNLMPMLILRREAKDTTYATILQPVKGAAAENWQWLPNPGGFVANAAGPYLVAFSNNPSRPYQTPAGRFTGQLAAVALAGNDPGYSLVKGTRLEIGGLTIQTDKPVSLFVRAPEQQPTAIVMGYDSEAKLTYQLPGKQPVTIQAKPRQTYQIGR